MVKEPEFEFVVELDDNDLEHEVGGTSIPWEGFLAHKTKRDDGGWQYTHERLVRARNSVNRLIGAEVLFTYTDPQFEGRCRR